MFGVSIWNRIKKSVTDASSAFSAIQQAGLDWTVSKQVLTRFSNGNYIVSKSVSLVRDDANLELAVVGKKYSPMQNSVSFDVLNPLIEAGLVEIEAAGAIAEGVRTFLLAKVKDATGKVGSEDVDLYILCTNSHGYAAVNFGFLPIVRSTGRTLANVGKTVKLTHRGQIEKKVKNLANAMDLAKGEFTASLEQMDEMQKVGMTSESFRELVKVVIKSKNANANGVRKLEKVLSYGAQVTNVLDAYMAIAEYLNSSSAGRSTDSVITSLWYGQGKNQQRTAFETCVELVKAANKEAV